MKGLPRRSKTLGFANTSICRELKTKAALSSSTREQCQRKQICPLALLLGSAPTLPSPAADCAHRSERTHGQTHRWRTISIVDLRQPMDIEAFPQMIPGALRIGMEDRRPPRRDSPGPRRRPLLLVTLTKRPAPGWRCCCERKESPGFARSKAASTPGSRPISHSLPKAWSRNPLSYERSSPYCPVTGIVDPMNSATFRLSQMSKV